MKKALILAVLLLIAGCQGNNISKEARFRIDVLYEHTIAMGDFFSAVELKQIGLDISKIDNSTALAPEQKLEQLEASFETKTNGNYDERIIILEDKMAQLMTSLIKAQRQNKTN